MRKVTTRPLTDDQVAQLVALNERRTDTDDIPEAPRENWARAERGKFFRPLKHPISIRLDADVLDWVKRRAAGGRYQTEINRILRKHMEDAGG